MEEIENKNLNAKKSKTDHTLNTQESNINETVPETDKVNTSSQVDINTRLKSDLNKPRRSARIQNIPSISYNEEDNVTECLYT